MPVYKYSEATNRFYDEDGSALGRIEVRQELDNLIESSSQKIKEISQELLNDNISLAEWQQEMGEQIEQIQIASYALANGGFNALTAEDNTRIDDYIDRQYEYLQNFAEQIYTGQQRNDRSLSYRASLYAQSGRVTYEAERRFVEEEAGATEELNILGGSDHCGGCLTATAMGWVEIGTLPAIGDRECGAKCHCSIVYRKGPKDTLGSELERF